MPRPRLSLLAAAVLLLAPASAHAAVWGSFDGSRINYAGGVLTTGNDHTQLRSIIMLEGDTLAPGTPVLDAAYLGGVDIFYTSLPDNGDPPLSAAEQAAVQAWVAGGGTLIVTADANPLPTYESFTQAYGVTGYVNAGASTATPVGMHPITAGVTDIDPALQVTFSYGADAQQIAVDDLGQTFMVVLDENTGFCSGGRILVVGDHNLFSDNYIANVDNTLLATNMVAWARTPTLGGCTCGDGVVDPGESCDDANMIDTDACVGCADAACGDGFVWAGMEACDDGNMDDTDACIAGCVDASCGDGFVWAGVEDCDDANMDDTDACTAGCTLAFCGDGHVWAGMEECDDANLDDTDACVPGCSLAACGDGHVWAGMEECDDADANDNDECTTLCTLAACGDGFLQAGVEACDDGNTDDTDACVAGCVDASCGDGFVWEGMEECDDANDDDTDACLAGCIAAACGDGVLYEGVEECDDGNVNPGDGCSAECAIEGEDSSTGADDTTGAPDDSTGGSGGATSGADETAGDTTGDGDETGVDASTSGPGASGGEVDPGGCSCRSTPRGSAPWWGLVGLLAVARRRRSGTHRRA